MTDNLEVKKFIASELANDVKLTDIQNSVNEKFNLKLTFMEIRILASELENIDWDKNAPKKEEPKKEEPVQLVPRANTLVEKSPIARPGMIANGTVTFLSGVSAEWMIDETGKLGVDKLNGQPTEEDVKDFQVELKKLFGQD